MGIGASAPALAEGMDSGSPGSYVSSGETTVLRSPAQLETDRAGGEAAAEAAANASEEAAETDSEAAVPEAEVAEAEVAEAEVAEAEVAEAAAAEPEVTAQTPTSAAPTSAASASAAPSISKVRADIVRHTNKLRTDKGLAPLKSDQRLDGVAQTWTRSEAGHNAANMKHNPLVGAQVPDGWRVVGENVAWGQRSAAEVVAAWRDSPGHYANMMKAEFTHIGVGIAYSSSGRAYYTQVFAGYPHGLSTPGVFTDVAPGAKFAKEIEWMLSSGLSTGVATPAGRAYRPKASVSREAMAAFLYRLETPSGASKPAGYTIPKSSPFADVPTNHKFFKEIAWMSWSGVSTGIARPSGKPGYAPKAAVSREAMAAFIARLQGDRSYSAPNTSPFADVNRGHKFYKQIAWMYDSKLSTGVKQPRGKPLYQPGANVSREAMAAFIYRLEH